MTTKPMNSPVVVVNTPDGKMHVIVMEDEDGRPKRIRVGIGKSGTAVNAWCNATSELVTMLLERDIPLPLVLGKLLANSTDRSSFNTEGNVRSGPEGIAYALLVYLRHKHVALNNKPYWHQPWVKP